VVGWVERSETHQRVQGFDIGTSRIQGIEGLRIRGLEDWKVRGFETKIQYS
jgi:hypothetical protein